MMTALKDWIVIDDAHNVLDSFDSEKEATNFAFSCRQHPAARFDELLIVKKAGVVTRRALRRLRDG